MAKPFNHAKRFFKTLVFILVAIPILSIFSVGKLLLHSSQLRADKLGLINEVRADVPGGGGGDGWWGGGGGGDSNGGGAGGGCGNGK